MASHCFARTFTTSGFAISVTASGWVMVLLSGWLAVPTVAAAWVPQASQYSEIKPIDRYYQASEGPRLTNADGVPEFKALTDAEAKKIVADNSASRSNIKDDQKKVESILETGGDINSPLIGEFFNGYVFAEMTRLDVEKISNLGQMREEFFKDYLSRKVSGQTRQQFIETVVIPSMQKIYANEALHPAARLNAVCILGLLDSQVANRNSNQIPVPAIAALDELMKIYGSEQAPGYLKVAALVGIQHHVETDRIAGGQLSEERKTEIASLANKVLSGSAAGQAGWEPELDYWLRRGAVQMLGLLGNANALDTVLGVLKSKDASLWLQFDALQALDKLDLSAAGPEKVSQATLVTATFLAQNLENESVTINDNLAELVFTNMLFQDLDLEEIGTDWVSDRPVATTGGGGMGGSMGGGMGGGRDDRGPVGPMGGSRGPTGPGPMRGPVGPVGPSGGGGFGGYGGDNRDGGNFGGFGGFGAMGGSDTRVVDLPNYLINVSRRRVKALAFVGVQVLKSEGRGLYAVADVETKGLIDQVVSDLQRLLKDSNVGIVNLDDQPREPLGNFNEPPPKESVAKKLAEMAAKTAASLKTKITSVQGEEAAAIIATPAAAGDLPDFGN